ncbi:hypothetical protein ES708_22549 [subsurface metagenome]
MINYVKKEKNMKSIELTFKQALIGFMLPIITLLVIVLNGINLIIALLTAIIILSIFGLVMGFGMEDIQKALTQGVARIFSAVEIMLLVGILIGVWMSSGSVPSMLYYGLKIITPMFFLPISFILCALTSLVTGTSWGTAGTVGLALIGVAAGMGIPLPWAAGAIISGAHVGDKLSPLSDTTLLASASTGTRIFDHIISMFYTTIPISIICIFIYIYNYRF